MTAARSAATSVALCAALLTAAACSERSPSGPGTPGRQGDDIRLSFELVVRGLSQPVFMAQPPGDGRFFIVEQAGRIRIVVDGVLENIPFMDIRASVRDGGERGLLSMAFHPEYETNRQFYLFFTDLVGTTRVVRYLADAAGNTGDPSSAVDIIAVEQPFANHNGGFITFGPDSMLYVGLGDGGSGGDPQGHGQDSTTLLGSLLRIDVDNPDPGLAYGIPTDNPLVGRLDARGEIWVYGLRNPWRYSFDDGSGLLFIGDVGQGTQEEINAVPAADGGANFGWNVVEGTNCFLAAGCDTTGFAAPVLTYPTAVGGAVIGGYVYRGAAIPEIVGHYFYSDFGQGFLRSFRIEDGEAVDQEEWSIPTLNGNPLSFAQDADGELYLLLDSGRLVRLVGST